MHPGRLAPVWCTPAACKATTITPSCRQKLARTRLLGAGRVDRSSTHIISSIRLRLQGLQGRDGGANGYRSVEAARAPAPTVLLHPPAPFSACSSRKDRRFRQPALQERAAHGPRAQATYLFSVPRNQHTESPQQLRTCSTVFTETPRIASGPIMRRTAAAGRSSCRRKEGT